MPKITPNLKTPPNPSKKVLEYNNAENVYHEQVLSLINNALAERERGRIEFDGRGFSDYDTKNIELDLAYVEPAKNAQDVRIVSGITRQKTHTSVSVAKQYDFDVEYQVFDKDDEMLQELAKGLDIILEKVNQAQDWRDKRTTVYRGMVSRGTYFTMEVQDFIRKKRKSNLTQNALGDLNASWEDRWSKPEVEFRTVEIDPKLVILGDMNEGELERQPFIALGMDMTYLEAESLFGTWDRFKFVPEAEDEVSLSGGGDAFASYRDNYKLGKELKTGRVEVVYFMRNLRMGNELAIYLNGVAMLPIKFTEKKNEAGNTVYDFSGFPLTALSRSGEYPLVDWHLHRIPKFAYSKGQPAETKFDQDVLDFWMKFMVLKAYRSINPALGNKSGQQIRGEDISPGKIVSNLRKDDLFTLLPPEMIQGITAGEFSMAEFLKKEVDEKTLSREFDGQVLNQHQTATQFMENKKAQLVKLGALIDGIVRGEAKRAKLILKNSIIPFWFDAKGANTKDKKIGKGVASVFKSFTMDKDDRDGKYSADIMLATETDNINSFDVLSEEEKQFDLTGKKTKMMVIKPSDLDLVNMTFYANVKPRDRDNNALQIMLNDQSIAMAKNLFGTAVDDEKAQTRFAHTRGDSHSEWFHEQGTDMEMMLAKATGGLQGQADEGANGTRQGMRPTSAEGGLNPASLTPPLQAQLQK